MHAQVQPVVQRVDGSSTSQRPRRRSVAHAPPAVDRLGTGSLVKAARHAWRRSARCVGRAGWASLVVRDSRHLTTADAVAADLVAHLREATGAGALRPTMTVLHPDVRVLNEQLVRYADDPQYAGFVQSLTQQGWQPDGSRFEVMPLAVRDQARALTLHAVPPDAVLEVCLEHPLYAWFADLGLRWHAVPAISNMMLRVPRPDGPAVYPVVFNGWYVSDEISARNLADPGRYDVLPAVAERLRAEAPGRAAGERTADDDVLGGDGEAYWKQRALVEVEAAVLWSFRRARVKISAPHQEARRFMDHLRREARRGRAVPTDWSWVISPIAPVLLPTYHRYYDPPEAGNGPDLVQDPVLAPAGRHGWQPPAGTDVSAPDAPPAGSPAAKVAACPHSAAGRPAVSPDPAGTR